MLLGLNLLSCADLKQDDNFMKQIIRKAEREENNKGAGQPAYEPCHEKTGFL